MILEIIEVILKFLELSLLLQSAFHGALSILNETAKMREIVRNVKKPYLLSLF